MVGAVAFTITIAVLGSLVVSVHEVKAARPCFNFNGTNCASCTEKGDNCYWCPDTDECLEWNWGNYPSCKGNGYFYGQCDLNGVDFIIIFSVALFLLLVIIVICCVCCCCCYVKCRRRSEYVELTHYERNDMRHRRVQARQDARRNEIPRNYGPHTDDGNVQRLSTSVP